MLGALLPINKLSVKKGLSTIFSEASSWVYLTMGFVIEHYYFNIHLQSISKPSFGCKLIDIRVLKTQVIT